MPGGMCKCLCICLGLSLGAWVSNSHGKLACARWHVQLLMPNGGAWVCDWLSCMFWVMGVWFVGFMILSWVLSLGLWSFGVWRFVCCKFWAGALWRNGVHGVYPMAPDTSITSGVCIVKQPALGNLVACCCFPHLLVQWMMHLLPQCPSPWNLTKPWIKVINKPMWGCTDPCQCKISPTPSPQSFITHTLTTTSHYMPGSAVAPGQYIMGL